MDRIKLDREWKVVARIGSGGFGQVYRAVSGGEERALKLVPKDPGAERELLFVEMTGAKNVVPILEFGETPDAWVMLMPLAECSLRDQIDSHGPLPLDDAIAVLLDLCQALDSISNQVVHRDIKPENILLLDGKWCLADFGIARYAEATTHAKTRKYALTPAYAASERWRMERASTATDVYSLGVVAYELIDGRLPFEGPTAEDFREQHLHAEAPRIKSAPTALAAVVEECLFKSPGARPSTANLLARLDRVESAPSSPGRSRLVAANYDEARRRAEAELQRSRETTEAERRDELHSSAERSLTDLGQSLLDVITGGAPASAVSHQRNGGWSVKLGLAQLSLSGISRTTTNQWHRESPAFDVIAHASLELSIPVDRYGWAGRSHSLWFCDARETAVYAWFETAFMNSVLTDRTSDKAPFALAPGEEAAKALWPGMAEY